MKSEDKSEAEIIAKAEKVVDDMIKSIASSRMCWDVLKNLSIPEKLYKSLFLGYRKMDSDCKTIQQHYGTGNYHEVKSIIEFIVKNMNSALQDSYKNTIFVNRKELDAVLKDLRESTTNRILD